MRDRPRKKTVWQTSLRTLLIVMLVTGAIAGLFGPDLVQALRSHWFSPPAAPLSPTPPPMPHPVEEPNGYFESAETPLR